MQGNTHNHKFQVRIKVIEAHGLMKKDRKDQSDPFVVAKLKGMKNMMSSVKTNVVNNNPNPIWNQELDLFVPNTTDVLLLKCFDKDPIKSSLLGMVEIPLGSFYNKTPSDSWLHLMQRKGNWKKLMGKQPMWNQVPGSLHIMLWFGDVSSIFPGFMTTQTGANNSAFVPRSPMVVGTMPATTVIQETTTVTTAPMMTTPMTTNTTMMDTPVPVLATPPMVPVHSLETPTYHEENWAAKDSEFGYQEVNPAKFQWYNSGVATTSTSTTMNTGL